MSSFDGGPRKRRKISPPEPGPYVLRNVLDDIPLKADDSQEEVSITCVEYWSR
jgi:vacuolar protein sorting-associated protein 3